MNDPRLEMILTAKDLASGSITGLEKNLGKLESGLNSATATGTKTGNMFGALSGFALAAGTGIVLGLGGAMVDFAHKAAEDEVATQRLRSSLQANVPAWDGNTQAIDRQSKAMQALGFTNDETKNSLAAIVPVTHDLTQATELQNAAADLARFKQISLQDATTALVSLEAGRARGLAQLGINVKDFATTEERLAAVEKVAGGQAAAYAKTDLGQLDAATAKVDEAQEKMGKGMLHLGAIVLPAAADGVTLVADALDNLQTQLDSTATNEQKLQAGTTFFDDLASVLPILGPLADKLDALTGSVHDFASTTEEQTGKLADDLANGSAQMVDAVRAGIVLPLELGTETARRQAADTIAKTPGDLAQALIDGKGKAADAMDALMQAMQHPISTHRRIMKLESELNGKALADGLASSDPYVRAQAIQTRDAIEAELEALRKTAKGYGSSTAKAYADGLEAEYGYVQGAAQAVARAATSVLKASSPPGPLSPLHEIDKWGARTIQAFADGVRGGADDVMGAFKDATSAGVSGIGTGAASLTGGGSRGGATSGAIPPIHLYIDGREVAIAMDEHMYRRMAPGGAGSSR